MDGSPDAPDVRAAVAEARADELRRAMAEQRRFAVLALVVLAAVAAVALIVLGIVAFNAVDDAAGALTSR